MDLEVTTSVEPQVMLIGLAGCGKTQSCTGLLKKLNPEAMHGHDDLSHWWSKW